MDDHEICRKHIQKLESELTESHDREADLELEIAEKDELIANMAAELDRCRKDREFVVPEGVVA